MDRIYVMQLVRSFQVGEISRRTFLRRTTAALGSVAAANVLLAACSPVLDPSMMTPNPVVDEEATANQPAVGEMTTSDGVVSGMVAYPDPDGEELTGHLAYPEGDGAHPGIIVIQEWWGLNDHIKDVADRFAAAGYVALAPDLYKGQVATEPDEARKLVMELDMAEAVNEIQAAMDYLLAQENVAGDKAGIVGFCMGGRLVLMTGLASDDVGAAVAYYGSPLTPEEAANFKAPLMGHYGTADQGIPVEGVETMGQAMTDAGIENEIYIYDGAQHAFFNDTRASSYDADAAAASWERTLGWFADRL
ncbi:MAG: dienelactone hydrolase family protein [Caldilineaceae bacterium]|nr:dienelactone hydrolase family protein [Caldilineaceae bacterium]